MYKLNIIYDLLDNFASVICICVFYNISLVFGVIPATVVQLKKWRYIYLSVLSYIKRIRSKYFVLLNILQANGNFYYTMSSPQGPACITLIYGVGELAGEPVTNRGHHHCSLAESP